MSDMAGAIPRLMELTGTFGIHVITCLIIHVAMILVLIGTMLPRMLRKPIEIAITPFCLSPNHLTLYAYSIDFFLPILTFFQVLDGHLGALHPAHGQSINILQRAFI